jgi:hypothetical protein
VGHLEPQCQNIQGHRSHSQHPKQKSKVGLIQIGSVHQALPSGSPIQMAIEVNKAWVQFYLDTGTEVNVMNQETYQRIGAPTLQPCDIKSPYVQWPNCDVPWERKGKIPASQTYYFRGVLRRSSGLTKPVKPPYHEANGLYLMDAEADNTEQQQPLALSVKTDTATSGRETSHCSCKKGGDGMSPTKATQDARQGGRGAAAACHPPKTTRHSWPPAARSSTLHRTIPDSSAAGLMPVRGDPGLQTSQKTRQHASLGIP